MAESCWNCGNPLDADDRCALCALVTRRGDKCPHCERPTPCTHFHSDHFCLRCDGRPCVCDSGYEGGGIAIEQEDLIQLLHEDRQQWGLLYAGVYTWAISIGQDAELSAWLKANNYPKPKIWEPEKELSEREKLRALLEECEEALKNAKEALMHSYEVMGYPANGKTMQDASIKECDTLLEKLKEGRA